MSNNRLEVTERWSLAALDRAWSAKHILLADREAGKDTIQYAIKGLLARTGTAVWYGAGSTGKTQILLSMAASIAAPRDRVPRWLGQEIQCSGHILVLSAEDTQEHLRLRLRATLQDGLGMDMDEALQVCERLHVMPFLSMSETDFDHPSASLFKQERDGRWAPSDVLGQIRAFIQTWNERAETDDEKIVGVVMDSATSMAGFEAMNQDAVTNFFFYLNRLCEALDLFWVVIGHTPKAARINPKDPDADAPARLRGVALWTTAPRMTVEVRAALGPQGGKKHDPYEAEPVIQSGLATSTSDVLVVKVAKSNLHDAYRGKRFLVRKPGGILVDVTDEIPTKAPSAQTVAEAPQPPRVNDKPKQTPERLEAGTSAVWDLIKRVTLGDVGSRVSAHSLDQKRAEFISEIPELATVLKPGTLPNGGGPRPGAWNWHLDQLHKRGALARAGNSYKLLGEPSTSPAAMTIEIVDLKAAA